MGVRATMGAYTLEDKEVVGKGLSCSLGPLNYHMAVRIVVLCVNIPFFSQGDSDLESTVQQPQEPVPGFAAAYPRIGLDNSCQRVGHGGQSPSSPAKGLALVHSSHPHLH